MAEPKASGNDANNAGPTPKPAAPAPKAQAKAAEKEAPVVSNAPDPSTDPEAIKDAQADSVLENTTVNRSHTLLFNDSQGNQRYAFHISSNNFATAISEPQLRSIMDKAGYELADSVDD